MYSITSRRWFFPCVLAVALIAQWLCLRAVWPVEMQRDSKFRTLQVRSSYELLLEAPAGESAQPILSYSATKRHDHRLTLDMRSARLSDETLRLLALVNPPKNTGRLIYAPDPSETAQRDPGCLANFRIEFPAGAKAARQSVAIAPPTGEDVFDSSTTRLVHVVGVSPLIVRVSANSSEGASGPGCRNLLSIGNWQQVIGKDLELAFVADPGSRIDVTLSSDSFASGEREIESLEIERVLPERLVTRPLGGTRAIQTRNRMGPPPLTITDLKLGDSFFDVELNGKAGIPITEIAGWTKWPVLAAIDLPLLACAIGVLLLKNTVFISYSWSDRDRVLPVYERLKQTGLKVWIDREQLRGGADWEERIRREMLKCRRVVIFLSRSLNDGGFLLAELGLARAIANDRFKRKTFLIPVRLEDCPIPPILSQWNAIDLFADGGEQRLFEDLGVRVSGAARPQEATARG